MALNYFFNPRAIHASLIQKVTKETLVWKLKTLKV